jgi:hypothetical protein
MGLDDDQVYLWDQKIDIPTDERLYIAVAEIGFKAIGVKREYIPVDMGGLNEQLSVAMQSLYTIDIFSRDQSARDRKEEILMAFLSTNAEQVQETEFFFIAPHSTNFQNLSLVDGSAIPYRFQIIVAVHYTVSKAPGAVDYYDQFPDPEITEDP